MKCKVVIGAGEDTGFSRGGGAKLPDIIIWVVISNTVDLENIPVV